MLLGHGERAERAQLAGAVPVSCCRAGTLNTAPAAAILGSRQQAGALALSAGFMDSIDALEEEIRGMGQQMQAEKQAAGKMRSVREDLELRAKVCCSSKISWAHRVLDLPLTKPERASLAMRPCGHGYETGPTLPGMQQGF